MAEEIAEPKAGDSTFVLWKVVAQLVRLVKPLSKIQIKPTGSGKVIYADGNCIFDLKSPLTVAVEDFDDFEAGEPEVPNTAKIIFSSLFKIHNLGGMVQVDLKTEECVCDDGSTDGGDSA